MCPARKIAEHDGSGAQGVATQSDNGVNVLVRRMGCALMPVT